jgi:hypothetical protein
MKKVAIKLLEGKSYAEPGKPTFVGGIPFITVDPDLISWAEDNTRFEVMVIQHDEEAEKLVDKVEYIIKPKVVKDPKPKTKIFEAEKKKKVKKKPKKE